MDAVQRLRARAQTQGTLATTPQQTVVVEQAPQPIIQIVPVNPQVIYVPVYNPVVVYGPWLYPAYPPYYYYPVGWPVGGAFFSFGPGIFVGIGLWGIFDWHRHHVVIDAPRYRRFTDVVNVEARRDELERVRAVRVEGNRFSWEHDVVHRRGVGYRDASIQQRVGGPRPSDAAPREPFRGRIEPGRVDQGRAPQTGVEPRRVDQGGAPQTGVEPRRVDQGRVQPDRTESRRVEPGRAQPGRTDQAGRAQPGRTDQERGQPDWAGRVPPGRVQPPAEQPRPSVQAPARPEAGRARPESVPRVETAPRVETVPPAPGQRREPGMFQGMGNGGDARAHGERGRESRQAIAPPAPAPRTAPPPVSAPAPPPAAVAPPSRPPAPSAPVPSGPPAQRPHGGGAPGREKRS